MACVKVFVVILLLLFIRLSKEEFTSDFSKFIEINYNVSTRVRMERVDLGWGIWGSFGGKNSSNEVIRKRPVIFIPGAQLRSLMFAGGRNYFLQRGYNPSELYSTSYGDGGWTLLPFFRLDCRHVKKVRLFLEIVNKYTNKTVDIVTYSLGSPIVRKAILGGQCVDSNENIGPNITNIVNTFSVISGANYGVESCNFLHFFIPYCNEINGYYCLSKYMIDLNDQSKRYEGLNTYAFISETDLTAGKNCCGQNCSDLRYSTKNFSLQRSNHLSAVSDAIPQIYGLINSTSL
uniref:Lipase domain-containing protein n=1 Tax=Parastrongyloides trichosuri TaxID=131310 RepID=A0A0N4Z5D6_PARTI